MTKKPGIKVEIYGSEYRIKGDADVEYIKRVAAFVDERMKQVSQLTADSAVSKIAILAAINIADELFKERKQREDAAAELSEKLRMIEDESR
jgi:cell division protein ZapA